MTRRIMPPSSTPAANRLAAAESVLSALAFATMASIVHGFGDRIAWPVVACGRVIATFLMSLIILRMTHTPIMVRGNRTVWVRSLFGSVGLMCTFYALTHLYVTDASAIIATNPIWVMVILGIFFQHRVSGITIFNVVLAVTGVFVMKRPAFDATSFPLLIAFMAALIQAIVKVTLSFLRGVPSVAIVAHYAMMGSVTTLLISFFAVDRVVLDSSVSWTIWLWLIPVGVLGTLAQVMMTQAYKRGSTTLVALVGLSNVPMAAMYDVFIWHRGFDHWDVLGLAMIFVAIVATIRHDARTA
jgi:drug/metabolite transporter (DMT)-like permease